MVERIPRRSYLGDNACESFKQALGKENIAVCGDCCGVSESGLFEGFREEALK